MANAALLNNIDHKDLKVITRYGAEFGDNVNQTLVFPTEFAEIQREYPILFRRNDKGAWQAVALLGLDKGENLYLTEAGWMARHVPVIHQRGPFMIGFQTQQAGGETRSEPVIHVDLDNPRVSETEGLPVFLEHGGNSPYLERISTVLRALNHGIEMVGFMFEAFDRAGLIEPVSLEVRLDQDTVYKLPDFYTISEEKMAALDGAALEELHKAGWLRLAFLVLASMPNINRLIEMKNAKRASGAQ